MKPDLLESARKKGTDAEYRRWVQTQPSCISGQFSEWVNGEGRNPACHIRRAATSGTAHKAPYCCVPMTHDEHRLSHQSGELVCLAYHMDRQQLEQLFPPMPHLEKVRTAKEWFEQQAEEHLRQWIGASE